MAGNFSLEGGARGGGPDVIKHMYKFLKVNDMPNSASVQRMGDAFMMFQASVHDYRGSGPHPPCPPFTRGESNGIRHTSRASRNKNTRLMTTPPAVQMPSFHHPSLALPGSRKPI
jgi:hypothetical protein